MAEVNVDPAVLAVIKSADAPRGVPRASHPPEEMPGNVGFVQGVLGLVGTLRHGVGHLADHRAKYGDVYRMSFIGRPTVVVWDADEIQKIMRNEDRTWSTAMGWDAIMFNGLDTRTGNTGTLLTLDFDDHKVARKLVQPAFTMKAIEGYLAIATRAFARELPRWVERGRVDFKREIRTLLARVAGEIFTGITEPRDVAIVDRALTDFWSGMLAMSRNPRLSPTMRRARKGLETLIEMFLALAPERRKSGGADLFSQMCSAGSEGLGDEAMVRVFITIMFGAFDTTSAGMTSMAYLLAKHPEWQERLREEGAKLGAAPTTASTLKAMKQHEWVWKETLRLMPVNGFLPRRALRDVKIGDYDLPAGTLVLPTNGAIGRHPKWWRDPDVFDPERFSPERAEDQQHPGIYNPFGGGAHACVGMQLANMEVKVFWYEMLRRCRFRLTRDYDARHTFTPMGMVSGDVALTLDAI